MNNLKTVNRRCVGVAAALYGLIGCWILIFFIPFQGYAEEKSWQFALGGGGYVQNVYTGSDETFITALPYATAAYAKGRYSTVFSLIDGVSITYNTPVKNLAAGIKINSGDERDSEEYTALMVSKDHSDKVKELLAGTPTVKTDIMSEFKLDYTTAMGIFGCALEYHPTSIEGNSDRHYNGLVFALNYAKPFSITRRLALTAVAGVSLMDENYADAWFSLETSTQRLNAFDADAGLRDVQLSMQFQYAVSQQLNLMFLAKNAWLLDDAGQSPFTKSTYQMTWALFGVYNF